MSTITRRRRAGKEQDMADPLGDLTKNGVSIWLGDLSRQRPVSGSLAAEFGHPAGRPTREDIRA
jgi:hypothetical protein